MPGRLPAPHIRADFDNCLFPGNDRGGHLHAPGAHMQLLPPREEYIARNAAPGIPPRPRLMAVVHAHENFVLPLADQCRDVEFKPGIPVRMPAGPRSVDPHIRVHIHAVKLKKDLILPVFCKAERLFIPADAAARIPARTAARGMLVHRVIAAPVMGQLDPSPLCPCIRLLPLIRQGKHPVKAKEHPASRRGHLFKHCFHALSPLKTGSRQRLLPESVRFRFQTPQRV